MTALLERPFVVEECGAARVGPLELALAAIRERLPDEVHARAGSAIFLRAAGHSEAEIAKALDVTVRTLHRDRLEVRQAVLDGLRAEGLDEHGIALTVGAEGVMSDSRPGDRNSQ
jgi:DNA-directed RNA polymerase specialized sigma24 family protein